MRNLSWHLILCGASISLLGAPPLAAANHREDVAAKHIFIPTGFDDNDDVELVVDGVFNSSCYRLAQGSATIDREQRAIVLHPRAHFDAGACLAVFVPYTYTFELGKLAAGSWTVRTGDGLLSATLEVSEAQTSGPDNQLYAAIDNASVERRPDGQAQVVLEGQYTNTCMRWVGATIVNKNPQVIEVMPIVRVDQGEHCRDETFPFKGVAVPLPAMPSGRFLLHVRSMHGRSLNHVLSF